jgi:protein-tyrosine phosphatase
MVTRLVEFEACFNFRDLGGYAAAEGGTVRWGVLFRSDTLHRMTAGDLERFASLGIRTVFDLRASQELEDDGLLDPSAEATHVHLPVLDSVRREVTPDELAASPVFDPAQAYTYMLDVGGATMARLFEGLVAPGALPAVFHCTAGKDRTGIAAALVLGTLGVDDETIVADYALTADSMERSGRWIREHEPAMVERMKRYPPGALEAKADTMRLFLGALQARYGSVRDAVRALGVAPATIDALAAALLE